MMRAAIAHILPDRLGDEWDIDEMGRCGCHRCNMLRAAPEAELRKGRQPNDFSNSILSSGLVGRFPNGISNHSSAFSHRQRISRGAIDCRLMFQFRVQFSAENEDHE